MPQDPVRLRDAAIHRLGLMRRWMILAAAGLTAAFAWLVSAVLPGKSLGAKSAATVPQATNTSRPVTPALPAPASAAQLGVGSAGASESSIPPPPAAPQPAPAPSESAPSAPAPSVAAPSAPASSAPAPSAPVSGGS